MQRSTLFGVSSVLVRFTASVMMLSCVAIAGPPAARGGKRRTIPLAHAALGSPIAFVSLGNIAQVIPLDGNERFREPIAWLTSD